MTRWCHIIARAAATTTYLCSVNIAETIVKLCRFNYLHWLIFRSNLLSITQMSQTHSFAHEAFSYFGHISFLDVPYDFATQNLMRKPFLMVSQHIPVFFFIYLSDFKELSLCGPCGPFFPLLYFDVLCNCLIEIILLENEKKSIFYTFHIIHHCKRNSLCTENDTCRKALHSK